MTGHTITLLVGPNTLDNLAAAEVVYSRLRAGEPTPPPVPPAGPTVGEAVAGYLALCDRKAASGRVGVRSVRNYRYVLNQLVAAFGPRDLAAIPAEEFEGWAARPEWSSSYQNTTLGTVQQLLRWAKLPARITRPPKESRGADSVLTDDQFAQVLGAVKLLPNARGDLPQLLRVLRETGARPAEVCRLEAESVDVANGCTRQRAHKTKKKTGRDRVIFFNAAALAVVLAQTGRYPAGPLFRTRKGNAWTPNGIVKRLLVASERLGFHCTAYGLGRHSYCTKALVNGVPEPLVAALVGHTGTGMLTKHYSHVGSQARALREAAELATRGKAG